MLQSGDLVVAGSATNGLDLGAGAMVDFTAYLAALSPTGQLRWIRSSAGRDGSQWNNLTVDKNGRVLLVAYDPGVKALGGPPRDAARSADRWLVALDARGAYLCSRSCDAMLVHHVAVGKDGAILLTGSAQGALDLGGGPVPQLGRGVMDGVVARLDADGRHRWTRRFPTAGTVPLSGAILDDGSLVIASANLEASDGIEFVSREAGSGVVPRAGGLAKLDSSGGLLWARKLGGEIGISHMAPDGKDILVTGVVVGEGDFVGRRLRGGPQGSMLVARLDTAGTPRWLRVLDSASSLNPAGGKWIGPATGGDTVVGGYSIGLTLGAGAPLPRPYESQTDGFAFVRLDSAGHPKSARVLAPRVMHTAMGEGDAVFASAVFDGAFEIADGSRSAEGEAATRVIRTAGPEVLVIRVVP